MANSELFSCNCSGGLDSGRVGCQLFGWLVESQVTKFSLYNATATTQNIFAVYYESCSSLLCISHQPPVTSCFFG